MTFGWRWLFAAGLLAAVGCGDKPTRDDCDALVHHLVELEAGRATAGDPPASAPASQTKKVFDAVGLDYCLHDLSVEQVKCGLAAHSLEELGQTCDKP